MSNADEILKMTGDMDTTAFLHFLIKERFPNRILATCSLRARSLVLLKLISEIDPATPIVFCHALDPFPETLEYRARLIADLGLRDIRDPHEEDAEPVDGVSTFSEGLWAENPVDHTRAYRIVHLNRTLADVDCWISGVYHGPYTDDPAPRVTEQGGLIRINPLASWTKEQVQGFMADHNLKYHPRSPLRPPESAETEPEFLSYHF